MLLRYTPTAARQALSTAKVLIRRLRNMSSANPSKTDPSKAPPASSTTPLTGSAKRSSLTMQIILRRDLQTVHGWGVGPLLAQSAHAATAVLHLSSSHPDVILYQENWEEMRKAILEVPDEKSLRDIAMRLDRVEEKIPYHLWIEQPEGIPTALAIIPNKRPKKLKALLEEAGCTLWT